MNPEGRYHGILQQLVEKIEWMTARLRKVEATRQLFDVANEFSPDAFTSSPQNDFDSQDADVLRIRMSQATTLSGIQDGKQGRFLELYNASAFTLTLPHDDTGSLDANRFYTPGGTSKTITAGQRLRLYYDSTLGRWATG